MQNGQKFKVLISVLFTSEVKKNLFTKCQSGGSLVGGPRECKIRMAFGDTTIFLHGKG